MSKKQENNDRDVAAVIVAMTDAERPLLLETMRSVLSDPCIAQVILCIEKKNNWIDSTINPVSSDPRLEIVRLALAPPGAIRNAAVNHVRMPWIAFCDGDDVWCNEKILQRKYANETGSDFVGADHYLTDEAGKVRAFALARYMPMLSSWMVRTEVMKQYPFNETMFVAEDGQWWSRTEGKIIKARYPNMLLKYRVRYNSLSSVDGSKKRKVKIVALGSIPVLGKLVYLATGCLWLFTRKKQYIWHKGWGQRPGVGN